MAMKICVISGKGGTGKSTVSFGLGAALAQAGKSVLLVDLDEGLRCLDTLLGVDGEVVNDLSDIFDEKEVNYALYKSKCYDNLFLIPAPLETGVINYVNLSSFDKRIKDTFEVVIYDFPAGIDIEKLKAIDKSASFVIVSNMDVVSLKDAAAIRDCLDFAENKPRLIINRFYSQYIKDGIFTNIDEMINISGVRLAGIVPASFECATLSLTHRFSKKSRAMASFKRIAARLCGEDIKLPKIKNI